MKTQQVSVCVCVCVCVRQLTLEVNDFFSRQELKCWFLTISLCWP